MTFEFGYNAYFVETRWGNFIREAPKTWEIGIFGNFENDLYLEQNS